MGKETLYEGAIATTAKKYRVDPNLIKAIIRTESNWDANAIGDGGKAIGLMQIWLTTAQETSKLGSSLSKAILLKPGVNINQGVKYLVKQKKRYGSWAGAVAGYNAGTVTKTYKGAFTNQGYVDKVNRAYKSYAGRYKWPYKGSFLWYHYVAGIVVIGGVTMVAGKK